MKIKIKTISGFKKRFKVTKNKLVKYKKSNMRHLLTKKSSKRKRKLNNFSILNRKKIIKICVNTLL